MTTFILSVLLYIVACKTLVPQTQPEAQKTTKPHHSLDNEVTRW